MREPNLSKEKKRRNGWKICRRKLRKRNKIETVKTEKGNGIIKLGPRCEVLFSHSLSLLCLTFLYVSGMHHFGKRKKNSKKQKENKERRDIIRQRDVEEEQIKIM